MTIRQGSDGESEFARRVTGEVANWQRIATALGHPDEVGDATDEMSRRKLIARWVEAADSVYAVDEALTAANAPSGVVMDPKQALAHPYYREKGMVVEVSDPLQGTRQVIGSPLRFSASPAGPTGPAPLAGQHTFEILSEVLGYGSDQVARLLESGVLSEQRAPVS